MAASAAIRIEGLVKRFPRGVTAVAGLDLLVERGQVVGLTGPNGCGKSVTLRVLLGLVRPTAGRVLLFGEPVRPGARVLTRVGALVDGPGFVPHLSGLDNLRLAWRLTGRPEAEAHLEAALDVACLGAAIDRRYRTFTDRAHTGIVGSSLGGLVSLDAGVIRADAFGLIGALSPSTWWDDTWILAQVQSEPTLPVRVYVDSGDAGDSQDDVTDTSNLAQIFRTRSATLDYLVQHGGQHNEFYWRQRFPGAAAFLLGGR